MIAAFLTFAVIPAGGFGWAFGDGKLVTTSVAVGCEVAWISFGAILGRSLRLPIEQLPERASP